MEADRTPDTPAQKDRSQQRSQRFSHRSRNHASAHSDGAGDEVDVPAIGVHPLVPQKPAILIDTAQGLTDLIGRLRRAGTFAYDSEFIGELTYFPKLCLIQTATIDEICLIDPLAGFGLEPFWDLLCDPAVGKIVHAGEQDIEPVVRHVGRAPANFFDTQIAAGFIGMPYPVSLSKLVLEFTGVRLGKGLTFSHWDQRPLSEVQFRYAADDVRYLPRIHAEMRTRLEKNGHTAWMQSECDALCDTTLYRFDPQAQYLRVRGASGLPPRSLGVLRALTVWRDAAARADDVPPRSFLKDEILIDLARTPVKSVEKLDRVRGLPRPVESAHGAEMVRVTLEALDLAPDALPVPRETEQSPSEKFRTDALWALAQCMACGQQIDPALVSNRQDVADYHRAFQSGADLEPLRLMTGWRRAAVGDPLTNLLRGRADLRVRCRDGMIDASVFSS